MSAARNSGAIITQFGAIRRNALTRPCPPRPARSTGVKSVIRSHQLPKKMRGFEITHNSMLLTIFSASNYGGVCRNRGGVLIFDEKGPAEVHESSAPPVT